jgi:hypothetical protein
MRKFWSYVAAYAGWVVALALGILFIIVSRQAFPLVCARLIGPDNPDYYSLSQLVRLGSQVLMVILGGLWLIAAVVTEDRCRASVRKGRVTRYLQKVFGPELLLLFAAGLTLRLSLGAATGDAFVWLILVGLLATGLTLTVWGYTSFRFARLPLPRAFHHSSQ